MNIKKTFARSFAVIVLAPFALLGTATLASATQDNYKITERGIELPAGHRFGNNDHVNLRFDDGRTVNIHFEDKCRSKDLTHKPECSQVDAGLKASKAQLSQYIGKSVIPWSVLDQKSQRECLCWVQVAGFNYHFGENNEKSVCTGGTDKPKSSDTAGKDKPGKDKSDDDKSASDKNKSDKNHSKSDDKGKNNGSKNDSRSHKPGSSKNDKNCDKPKDHAVDPKKDRDEEPSGSEQTPTPKDSGVDDSDNTPDVPADEVDEGSENPTGDPISDESEPAEDAVPGPGDDGTDVPAIEEPADSSTPVERVVEVLGDEVTAAEPSPETPEAGTADVADESALAQTGMGILWISTTLGALALIAAGVGLTLSHRRRNA